MRGDATGTGAQAAPAPHADAPSAAGETTGTWSPFKRTPRWFRGGARLIHHAAWRLRLLEYLLSCIEREVTTTVRIPFGRRLWLWRHGFLGESGVIYDFDRYRPSDYVSDVERAVGSRLINGPHAILLDDKRHFDRLLTDYAEHMPATFGVLRNGTVVRREGGENDGPHPTLADLLEHEGSLALKPETGGGGRGFAALHLSARHGATVNGRPYDLTALSAHPEIEDGRLVGEFIRQHEDIAALYPRTTNTIRLLTMCDAMGRPFIARAVIRVGRARSEPTDNWIRGGLCAPVALDTGAIGVAAEFPAYSDRMQWHTTHPETGATIARVMIPHWNLVKSRVCEIAGGLPFLPYVGWDIVVTGDGFKFIEGNSYSGVNLFQIHEPLLTDPRVRAFYRRHGVLNH